MPNNNIVPPKAAKKPKNLTIHNDTRIDDYYWLNERENPEVIEYLNAENSYYEQMTKHTKSLQEDLFEEMKGRIKEDDESLPYKKNGYYYINRFRKGDEYPVYARKKGDLNAPEEILFDVNELAKGYDYYQLKGLSISPNNKLAIFGVDTVSRRQYTLQFKN
jgi:oligopeptidase B